jgi:nucleoside-diphosphate-sugar epimerase
VRTTDAIPKGAGVELCKGDLLDARSLNTALQGVSTICHLAAVVDYLAPKRLMRDVNVKGTKNLVDAAAAAGVKRIVYASSTSVYGKRLTKIPADESEPLNPSDFYGRTKAEAERIVQDSDLHYAILRPCDVYGPGFSEGYFAVFDALRRQRMRIIGSGGNLLHFVHVDDCAAAFELACSAGAGAFNIAGPEAMTQQELLGIAADALDVPAPAKHVSPWLAKALARISLCKALLAGSKPSMIPEYVEKLSANRAFDIGRAQRSLGYAPRVSLVRGIKSMVAEYLKWLQ